MTQSTTMIEGTTMTDGRRMTSGYHERVTRGIFAAALILVARYPGRQYTNEY